MNPYDYSNEHKENVEKIEIVGIDKLTTALEVLAGIKPAKLINLQMREALLYEELRYSEPGEGEDKVLQAAIEVKKELEDMIRNFELTGKWEER